jgi:predicted ABC-type ATPase
VTSSFGRRYCAFFVGLGTKNAKFYGLARLEIALEALQNTSAIVREQAVRRESFAFETTLSSRNYLPKLPLWRGAGYKVALHFFSLPTADMAIARVQQRVAHGGHSIAESVIRRRFDAGLHNFEHVYKHVVDRWHHYESSGNHPVVLAQGGTL